MKIGLYGGNFDPIHFGHLNLAFELMEKGGLDEVWFIPARLNPHKTHLNSVSIEHRLSMVQLAIQDIPRFKLLDIEKYLPEPSYTLNTIQAILDQYQQIANEYQFYFLLGADCISSFFRWYKPEEIVKRVPLLIGSRSACVRLEDCDSSPLIKEAIEKGCISTRLMDISSTDVRERLSKNWYCGHLVPQSVLQYIHQNHLY